MRRPGQDLEAKGLTEWMWDVLYWTWGCVVLVALVGDWAWWFYVCPFFFFFSLLRFFSLLSSLFSSFVLRRVSRAAPLEIENEGEDEEKKGLLNQLITNSVEPALLDRGPPLLGLAGVHYFHGDAAGLGDGSVCWCWWWGAGRRWC